MVDRTATATWSGTLTGGKGSVTSGTGSFTDLDVTWSARTADPEGMTSPEELIAAAHATCFAMAFSFVLQNNGTPAERLDVTATVGFGPKDGGGMEDKYSNLKVVGKVPGLTAEEFDKLAVEGEAGCPVSNALRGNITIGLESKLAK